MIDYLTALGFDMDAINDKIIQNGSVCISANTLEKAQTQNDTN